jgi:hypothetical protein
LRTAIVVGVVALAAGVFFAWNRLAALGLTAVIVSLLPCLAMCALGVCAARRDSQDTGAAVSSNEVTRKEIS